MCWPDGLVERSIAKQRNSPSVPLACRKSAFVLLFLGQYLVLFYKQPCRQLPKQRKNYAGVSSGAHKHLQSPWCYLEPFPGCGEEKSHQGSFPFPPPPAFHY